VLSTGSDGILNYVNPAALQLCHDLRLKRVEDILPDTHNELVRTCVNTGKPLKYECTIDRHTLVWSYLPTGSSNLIYIYGHDVTEYRPEAVLGQLNNILIRLYDLTRAEARLTEQLVNGVSLKQASEELGIAISTARSQLKCVFRKTGTARQSELIRCILMGPTA